MPGRPIVQQGQRCSSAGRRKFRRILLRARAKLANVVNVGHQQTQITGNDPFLVVTYFKDLNLHSSRSEMNDSTEGKQSRLSCCFKRREEMKLKECVSILPQKKSPSVRFSKDGTLLALTLLLALVSCCLTVVSFCRVAALESELRSLREEVQEHQTEQRPGPLRVGAAAARAAVQEVPAATSVLKVSLQQLKPQAQFFLQCCLPYFKCLCHNLRFFSLQGIFAPPASGESNSSQSIRSKRSAQGPEETGKFGAQKPFRVGDPSLPRSGGYHQLGERKVNITQKMFNLPLKLDLALKQAQALAGLIGCTARFVLK